MLKQIGKYTISERIGRGTYSRVYRAVDSQGRPVAIKVSTTATEPAHLNEFQKDLVAAASVLHPNLVAVHDLGFEDDFPYLVMELVEGHDLDKLVKSNAAPSLAERIRVMQQIGTALKTAHERGVYHLDLRPGKIMMGEDGAAKLLGLGLGRLSYDPARVTEHGYLVGAPFYMSPERLTAIDTADARCDIWSFGVTFYEWISGRHPFYDDDGDRMIGNIMDGAPAALANVPAPLNDAILRALEKEPGDRYRNFSELLADLQPLVSDLKREESDALMAEALKQTDSGRWHEARRIARKMRDLEPRHGAESQMFGFSDQESEIVERGRPVANTAVAASVQPLVAAASLATAVETPDPAPPPPPPVQRRPSPPPAPLAPSVAPTPRPQRPERTAPRIPAIGVKNGAAAPAENGSAAAAARVNPAPASANGAARLAAAAATGGNTMAASVSTAAAAKPAVLRDTEPAPRVEAPRIRPASNPRSLVAPSQPAVRILAVDEPRSFPWVKILGFAVPALLMIGAVFFFLRPTANLLKAVRPSDERKEITPASRVITGETPEITADASTSTKTEKPAGATSVPNSTTPQDPSTTLPAATDPLNPILPARVFDPKSLIVPKVEPPNRRKGNSLVAGLAPPAFGGSSEMGDTAGLLALNAPPPPPARPAATAPPAPAPVTTIAPITTPSPQESRAPAAHVGGSFAEPVLEHQVNPIYPPTAVQRKMQGVVHFQVTVAKDGSVKNVQLLSGDPILNVAAKQAVLKWKYRPATLNGEPVEVTQSILVRFNLNNQ